MTRDERKDGTNTDTAPHWYQTQGCWRAVGFVLPASCKWQELRQTHSNFCHKQPSCSCQGNWHNHSFQLQYSLTPFGQVTTETLQGSHHPDITHNLNEMPSQLCVHTRVYICLFPPRLEQFLLCLYGSLKQQDPCSEGQGCSGLCLPSPGLHSLGTQGVLLH